MDVYENLTALINSKGITAGDASDSFPPKVIPQRKCHVEAGLDEELFAITDASATAI